MACRNSELNIDWHMPSQTEFQSLQSLFSKLVLAELKYLDENENCEREDLQCRLRVITECIKGAGEFMPPLESEKYTL